MGASTAQVLALLSSYGYAWRHSYDENVEFAVTEPSPAK